MPSARQEVREVRIMNNASRYAWNSYQRQGRRIPKPARLGWTFLIGACILIAIARMAIPVQHSPASSLNSFQCAGRFSKLEKQMQDNYSVFLAELNDKQRQINELKIKAGQLPGVMKP